MMKTTVLHGAALLVMALIIAGCGNEDGSTAVSASGNGVYNNISTGIRPVARQE